ncbi:MAG: hypothetical protein AB7O24_25710 [Kofleriaceae bacterium]
MRTIGSLLAVVAISTIAACGRTATSGPAALADPIGDDGDVKDTITRELQDDVLASYERDDPPDVDTGMISAAIGAARIGVGPGDVLVADELHRAPSRWPLRIERDMPNEIRSKRLETHLAQDQSAAWVVDELSWRIRMCGRTAVIPLRLTALYARDGDRWVQVVEHVSFGSPPTPRRDGELYGKTVPPGSIPDSGDLRDELSRVVSPLFSSAPRNANAIASGPEGVLLGPEIESEWHGVDVLTARLPIAKFEERRIGTIGRSLASSTIAYWVGNIVADVPARPGVAAGKARLRVTFVFEHRRLVEHDVSSDDDPSAKRATPEAKSCAADPEGCRWVLVQGHVSQPVGDQDLALKVFGTALMSSNLEGGEPLRLTCDDGAAATPPRRPTATTPATKPTTKSK